LRSARLTFEWKAPDWRLASGGIELLERAALRVTVPGQFTIPELLLGESLERRLAKAVLIFRRPEPSKAKKFINRRIL